MLKKLFFILALFSCSHLNAYQHDLAICAIFQNEGRFLKEWLEFHKMMGVQHFYLYNSNSTDNCMKILKPYIDAKEIELFFWNYPKPPAQLKAYNDCLKRTRMRVKWVAFLDLDEFLFPVQSDNLLTFLKEYEAFDAVCANWVMFGTSDIDVIPENKLSIELLTMCNRSYPSNIHVKSIVKPEKVKSMSEHYPTFFNDKSFQITADKVRFAGAFAPSIAIDKLRINHYWVRDRKWFYEVKIPRRIKGRPTTVTLESMEKEAQEINIEPDFTILRFKDELQRRVFETPSV